MRARRVGVAALCVTVGLGGWWWLGRPALSRRDDVAARRSIYSSFAVYPGAVKVGERSYEIQLGDGGGSGDYGLTVTYRLPAETSAAEALAFLRRHIPRGWHEASDETCARLVAQLPPPPPTAPGAASPTGYSPAPLLLMARLSALTVLGPGEDGTADGEVHGLTFTLSRRGSEKRLTLDQVSFGCQGSPDPDTAADEFDRV